MGRQYSTPIGVLVGNPIGKKSIGRPRSRQEYDIRMDLREIGWDSMEWIDLAQDRDEWWALVNTAINLRVPSNSGKFLKSCATGDFS
jgi:hypothetical protein